MRCPVCGAEGSLSPLGKLVSTTPHGGSPELRFKRKNAIHSEPTFTAKLARACAKCGVLLPYLDFQQRSMLSTAMDELIPYDR
ncbi:MAG TPA: hypothetical protein VGL02_21995 [Streptomyces sp.]